MPAVGKLTPRAAPRGQLLRCPVRGQGHLVTCPALMKLGCSETHILNPNSRPKKAPHPSGGSQVAHIPWESLGATESPTTVSEPAAWSAKELCTKKILPGKC